MLRVCMCVRMCACVHAGTICVSRCQNYSWQISFHQPTLSGGLHIYSIYPHFKKIPDLAFFGWEHLSFIAFDTGNWLFHSIIFFHYVTAWWKALISAMVWLSLITWSLTYLITKTLASQRLFRLTKFLSFSLETYRVLTPHITLVI